METNDDIGITPAQLRTLFTLGYPAHRAQYLTRRTARNIISRMLAEHAQQQEQRRLAREQKDAVLAEDVARAWARLRDLERRWEARSPIQS